IDNAASRARATTIGALRPGALPGTTTSTATPRARAASTIRIATGRGIRVLQVGAPLRPRQDPWTTGPAGGVRAADPRWPPPGAWPASPLADQEGSYDPSAGGA